MLKHAVAVLALLAGVAVAEEAEPRLLWTRQVQGIHQGCAAVSDGQLFAPILGGSSIVSLDASSGEVRWTRSLSDSSPFPPIIDRDSVYVITGSCTLYRLSRQDGKVMWKHWLAGSIRSMPTLAGGKLYAAASDTPSHAPRPGGWHLVCLDAAKGKEQWAVGIGADILGAPLVTGAAAYVATHQGVLWAFDLVKEHALWRVEAGAQSMPVICGEWLVFWTSEGLTARRRRDGTVAWTWKAEPPAGPQQNAYGFRLPMIDGDRAYVHASATELACVELKDRSRAWTWSGGEEQPGGPVMVGGRVYFGTSKGTVVGLDAKDGRTLWALKTDALITDMPTIMDGKIYFHDLKGGVVAVDAATPEATGWGMWGGSASHTGATPPTQAPVVVTPSASDEEKDKGK